MRYPTLMDSAFAILRGGGSWSLKREVFRTLGILGALDPYRYHQIQLYLREQRLEAEAASLAAGARAGEGDMSPLDESDSGGDGMGGGKRHFSSLANVSTSAARVRGAGRSSNMSVGLMGVEGGAGAGSIPVGDSGEGGRQGVHGRSKREDNGIGDEGHGLLREKVPSPPPLALLDQIHDGSQVNGSILIERGRR